MKNIVFVRIDDRLIHGQVMTAWVHNKNANEIVVIDDEVANDDFLIMIMKSVIPENIMLKILSCDTAASYLEKDDPNINNRIIVLVKNPKTIYRLIQKGVKLTHLNVGGMGATKERKKLFRNIAATDEERELFREIIKEGVNVEIQVIPDDKSVDINKYL
ncbi:PTS system mannose/fructose/N-acetylgalactosamine-transporter subunit IIB [Sporolactobacillus sp. KGMB 08714]|uniref:PTS system mannose/fructose/N-acetylgalactosamine-transporter subunit IIB n=1 Tax=Sporolactobacillus sp. KGMB 08714 TaxID=3064704 RepID=UPI002FBD5208